MVKIYDFIFSKRFSHRLTRHLVFWIIFLTYFYYVNLIPGKPEDLFDSKIYSNAFELMIYFPVSVISVYITIYFLLPRYIMKEKYLGLIVIIGNLLIVYFLLALVLTMVLARITTNLPFQELPVTFRLFQPIRYGVSLPLTSAVLTAIIKILKNWQVEQKENELLQRQKISGEMQLLKTQFQPHFLYDALQHIYFLIRKKSPESPATILKLSDLLSYILYEKEHVPLQKELEIVKTYLSLKKIFYPEKILIHLNQGIINEDLYIVPSLLLSLVENCLERLLNAADHQFILNLSLRTDNNELYFQLEIKSSFENELKNATNDHEWIKSLKRIEMLYPGRHSSDVFSENGTISLLLVLELNGIFPTIKKEKFVLS